MAAVTTEASAREIAISAVVMRCGCDDPLSHAIEDLPCPTPRAIEDRGVVAYYNRNPLKRALHSLRGGRS